MTSLRVNPGFFTGSVDLTEDVILGWFDIYDAYWMHDGNPEKPHAELSSGKCSNGFFDVWKFLKDTGPRFCELFGLQIAKKLKTEGLTERHVDWVIGSPYAAITLSYEVAKQFKAIHYCPEKDPSDPKGKRMVWRREVIPEGAKVLQIEELTTTSGTFQEVCRAIKKGNPNPVEFLREVGVFVHRPPKLPVDYGDRRVVAVIEKEVWAVDPSECPLCKAGSKRVRPKTNWKELTGKS